MGCEQNVVSGSVLIRAQTQKAYLASICPLLVYIFFGACDMIGTKCCVKREKRERKMMNSCCFAASKPHPHDQPYPLTPKEKVPMAKGRDKDYRSSLVVSRYRRV